jgi:glyoxylase-like metal-dependent hydrolase (beta-lactamase superfamily II)
VQISERCYAVLGLAYQLPWVVNAGFIVGDEETLIIDTGGNAMAAATIHGYATAVGPSNRLRVVNTEQHFDHIGGNGFFGALEVPIHGHPKIARTDAEFAQERRGMPPHFHYGTALRNPDQGLPDAFDLGGCQVEVVQTPGHTPSNVSLWVAADRVLYCGDALTHLIEPNVATADVPQWLASLDRIEALDAELIVCGHGPVVLAEDVAQVIAAVRDVVASRGYYS